MVNSKFRDLNVMNIVLIALALIQYFLLTALNFQSDNYISMKISLDNSIQRIPVFIIFYISTYLILIFLAILIAFKASRTDFTLFLFSILILWSFVNFFHAFIPVNNIMRPEIKSEGFFFDSLKSLYQSVKPFNTFPSWHAATAALCAIVYFKLKFRRFVLFLILCVLIFLSPVFLKMTYTADILGGALIAFLSYFLASKVSTVKIKTETVQEIVKTFTLESLLQSVAIGIRDEATISSLIDNLTRIEKNLNEDDIQELQTIGMEMNPPIKSLKEEINLLINSIKVENQISKAKEMYSNNNKEYLPTDKEIRVASETLVNDACRAFDNPKFRYTLLQIKNRNREKINTSSIEQAAKGRSEDIIFKFKSFIDSHKKDLTAIRILSNNKNGHQSISFDDIKEVSRELRKPPYEITPDEIWNAFYRLDNSNVKPLKEEKNPANIISLTQFAIGKIDKLVPFSDKVDREFEKWIMENEKNGRVFNEIETEWLVMMKNYISTFLEINMLSFNNPPFIGKGGAAKAYNIFGPDLNRILFELNENLI